MEEKQRRVEEGIKQLIPYDLFKRLKEIQFNLQCENSMYLVESRSKVVQSQITLKEYIDLMKSLKMHYSRAGSFLQEQLYGNNYNTNLFCKTEDSTYSIFNSIPSLEDFLDIYSNTSINDKDKVDFFTFSVFPSLTNFFISSPRFSIKSIEEIIDKIYPKNPRLLFKLLRSFFVSPELLKFSSDVLQPIFSEFQHQFDSFPKSFKDAQKRFERLIEYELNKKDFIECPLFISHIIFYTKNPIIMFTESFLKLAFYSRETMLFYGLFHYSCPPSDSQVKFLQKIFISSNIEQIRAQEKFMNIFFKLLNDNDSFFEEPFKSFEGLKGYSNIIASTNDVEFFNSIKMRREMRFHAKPSLFICSEDKDESAINSEFEGPEADFNFEQKESCDYLFQNSNNSLGDSAGNNAAFLRHLLQYSDPIPELNQEDIQKNGLTFEKFLYEILVLRGPVESIPKRRIYAENLKYFYEFSLRSKNIDQILEPIFQKIILKDITNIKLYSKYFAEFLQISLIKDHIKKGLFINHYISFVFNNNIPLKLFSKHSNYLKNPEDLKIQYVSFTKKLSEKPDKLLKLFVMTNLFDKNLYQSYVEIHRNQCKPQPVQTAAVLNSIQNPELQQFAQNVLLNNRNDILKKLRDALNDTSIFRMMDLANDCFKKIVIAFKSQPSPEELADLKSYSIILANADNFKIVYHFCDTYLKSFSDVECVGDDIVFDLLIFSNDVLSAMEVFNKKIMAND